MLHVPRPSIFVRFVLTMSIAGLVFLIASFPGHIINAASSSIPAAEADQIEVDRWPIYTSERGGYSLRYPDGWEVEEGEKGTLFIVLPKGEHQDKITVTYFDFEKPETDDLAVWAERAYELGTHPETNRTFLPVSLDIIDPGGTSQQVRMQYPPSLPGGGYLITHGRLVLRVTTASKIDGFTDWLLPIANSLAFALDGPTDQQELSRPDEPPRFITFEALLQEAEDSRQATDALMYRLQTGKEADHILAEMSDYARSLYDHLIVSEAEVIADVDRRREEGTLPPPESSRPNSD